MEHIKHIKLDLDGSGNKLRVFNSNGDGNLGYRIYNIQKDSLDYEKLDYVEVRTSKNSETHEDNKQYHLIYHKSTKFKMDNCISL